jgi:spore coat polysaccharide biosynthesis protein SpsF
MKISAVVQARMNSSRFPGKIAKEINGVSLLEMNLKRILNSKKISDFILATTSNKDDDFTEYIGKKLNIKTFRGSEDDVLDRYYQAINKYSIIAPDYVVRLTADCPLIDSALIDQVIEFTINNKLDYCSNTLEITYPDGQDVEVFKFFCLEKAWNSAKISSEREHVTPYIWKNSTTKGGSIFQSGNFSQGFNFGDLRMTVDEPADFELIKILVEQLGKEKTWHEYANYILENKLFMINNNIVRNEGFLKSIIND